MSWRAAPPAMRARAVATLTLALALGGVFGAGAGGLAVLVGGLLTASAALQPRLPAGWRGAAGRLALIAAETALVGAALLVGDPLAARVPPAMLILSPAVLALCCLLVAQATGTRPLATAWAGGCAVLAWAGIRAVVLADPATLTRAMIDPEDYDTLADYLLVVTQPHYFSEQVWRLQMVSLLGLAVVLGLAAWRARRLARQAALSQAARGQLAAHFAAPVVEALLTRPGAGQGGATAAAVLDCDLVGYSASVAGQPPEATARLLRAYHGFVESAVFAQGGAVLKFTGDGVTAVFGLTGAAPDAATRALACARQLLADWPAAAAPLGLAAPPGLVLGLDHGPVRWGLVGEGQARSLVVLGPPMAGAARLQAATRAAGTPLLLGAALAALAGPEARAALHPADAEGLAWQLAAVPHG